MIDSVLTYNDTLELFTYSAGDQNRSFGIYFQGKGPKEWAEHDFLKDIMFLEYFTVVISLHRMGVHLKKKRIIAYVDNQAVVTIVNKRTSKLKAEHIPGKKKYT